MQKYAIINTCGREDCGDHERDPFGAYYLVQDVDKLSANFDACAALHAQIVADKDARISELENVLRQARGYLVNAAKGRTHWDGCSHPECVILREIDSLMER